MEKSVDMSSVDATTFLVPDLQWIILLNSLLTDVYPFTAPES